MERVQFSNFKVRFFSECWCSADVLLFSWFFLHYLNKNSYSIIYKRCFSKNFINFSRTGGAGAQGAAANGVVEHKEKPGPQSVRFEQYFLFFVIWMSGLVNRNFVPFQRNFIWLYLNLAANLTIRECAYCKSHKIINSMYSYFLQGTCWICWCMYFMKYSVYVSFLRFHFPIYYLPYVLQYLLIFSLLYAFTSIQSTIVLTYICTLVPDGATRKSNNRRVLTLKTRTWLNSSSKKAWKTRVTWVKTWNTRAKFKLDSCSNSTAWNSMKLELDKKWAWSGTSIYYLQIRSAKKGPFCIQWSVYQQRPDASCFLLFLCSDFLL